MAIGSFLKKAGGFVVDAGKFAHKYTPVGFIGGMLPKSAKIDYDAFDLSTQENRLGLTEQETANRNRQLEGSRDFFDMLEMQRQGQGPSVAREVLQQGTQDALQSQLALAQSSNSPLAGRVAAQNSAMAQGQAAGQAAILGQQEQLQATQMQQQVMGQQNQLVQFYESLGFSREQAQFQAQQAAQGVKLQNQEQKNKANAAILAGIASGVGAAV